MVYIKRREVRGFWSTTAALTRFGVSRGSRFAREDVSLHELPPRCRCGAVLKDDVVHFKEPIPSDVMEESEREALNAT